MPVIPRLAWNVHSNGYVPGGRLIFTFVDVPGCTVSSIFCPVTVNVCAVLGVEFVTVIVVPLFTVNVDGEKE